MNAFTSRLSSYFAAPAAVIGLALSSLVFAQPGAAASLAEVPDGSPQLAQEKIISNTSSGVTDAADATDATSTSNPGRSASTVIASETRIQGRLASANVSVGGAKGYTVVDPDVGRSSRQSNNGGKRLSPSIWEMFRF